ncbi:MAG: protein-methionine-sulfoxide reductase heme-binding subunit MsrQ [Candidatus Zeuxoniibacter abyssi]|nr:MAG: protein-methionine-sulfoxide reductase heme-binding subunit MsrQ [Candidatus Persebacteraceae bacterium AB1(2)]
MKRLRRLSALQYFVVKATLFLLCLAPAAMAGIALPQSVNPVEFLTRESGTNALRFLIITLCITPLRLATGLNWLIKLRRMFGLFTFSYAAVHFSVYLFLDLQLDFSVLFADIVKRKYITVGFTAWLILIALAATSNDWSIRRMGAKLWGKLHKAVYAAAPLAAVHFLWLKRGKDWSEPLIYLAIIVFLLALRHRKAQRFLSRFHG